MPASCPLVGPAAGLPGAAAMAGNVRQWLRNPTQPPIEGVVTAPLSRPTDLVTQHGSARVEALSDAIFSVALGLLIFDFAAMLQEIAQRETLAQHLHEHWPTVVAFTFGFVTILLSWVNHHAIFGYVRRVDTALLRANGLCLFAVALVPIPSSYLDVKLGSGGALQAVRGFGLELTLIAVAHLVLWRTAVRRGLTDPGSDPQRHAGMARIYVAGTVVSLIALAVSFANVLAGVALWVLLLAVFSLPGELALAAGRPRRRAPSSPEQQDGGGRPGVNPERAAA